MDRKGFPVSFARSASTAAIIGALASLIVSPRSEAATYTWNATSNRYWQNAFWTPSAGATGPVAGDTIGAVNTASPGSLSLDANYSLTYSVANFIRTGSGTWTIQAFDNGRIATDPVRNVNLAISGDLQADSSVTVFRSNTFAETTQATLGINVGGRLWARSGDFYLGTASSPATPWSSALSSLNVAGTTTINANRLIALWVQPGQAALGRVANNGVLQIYRAGVGTTQEGSVRIGTLGGTGRVMVSNFADVNLTASLNIVGGINGDYTGTLENGTAGNVLKVAKSGLGAQVFRGTGNTYSGGTIVSGGLLLAQNSAGSALGSGAVAVQGGGTLGGNGAINPGAGNDIVVDGTLRPGYYDIPEGSAFDPNTLTYLAGTLSLGFTGDSKLVLNDGSQLNYILGTTSSSIAFTQAGDWLDGSGNALLNLTLASGFDYDATYTIFSNVTTAGFDLAGVTGFDTGAYQWSWDQVGSDYVLSFQAIPEPSTVVLLGAGALFVGFRVWRKRRA